MSLVLKLRHDTTDLSFQDGAAGLQLAPNGWLPRTTPTGGFVTERLRLLAEAASHNALATVLQNLALFERYVNEYRIDRSTTTPVWLWSQTQNETSARRAVVQRLSWQFAGSWYDGVNSANSRQELDVEIERGPWERISAVAPPVMAATAGLSIAYNITSGGAIPGDIPARVNAIPITGANSDRFWIGVRSENKHGDLTKFVKVWEMEDGTLYNSAVTSYDSTASPGSGLSKVNKAANSSEQKLVRVRMNTAITGSDIQYNYGLFLWLLRAKVSSGSWYIRARFGYSNNDDDEYAWGQRRVTVSSTDWNLYPIGVYAMPPRQHKNLDGLIGTHSNDEYAAIQIYGETASGSGTLHLDCLLPVPLDEGYAIVENTGGNLFYVGESALGQPESIVQTGGGYLAPIFEGHDFRLRPGNNNLIIAHARASSSVLTDQVSVASSYGWYPRWVSLRGSE